MLWAEVNRNHPARIIYEAATPAQTGVDERRATENSADVLDSTLMSLTERRRRSFMNNFGQERVRVLDISRHRDICPHSASVFFGSQRGHKDPGQCGRFAPSRAGYASLREGLWLFCMAGH